MPYRRFQLKTDTTPLSAQCNADRGHTVVWSPDPAHPPPSLASKVPRRGPARRNSDQESGACRSRGSRPNLESTNRRSQTHPRTLPRSTARRDTRCDAIARAGRQSAGPGTAHHSFSRTPAPFSHRPFAYLSREDRSKNWLLTEKPSEVLGPLQSNSGV